MKKLYSGQPKPLKATVSRFIRLFKVCLIPVLVSSCYTYHAVHMPLSQEKKITDHIENMEEKPGSSISAGCCRKYYARIKACSEIADLNNKGVDLSINKKFVMAEKLFKEAVKKEETEGAPYNNLGIIYELKGKRKQAFAMYSKACILDPQNGYFRKNFLSFVDSGNGSEPE